MNKLQGKKILLVEDELDIQVLLPLNFPGAAFVTMKNGKQALDILQKRQEFDAIILDRFMPVMSGDEFMKEMAAKYPDLKIPIVMLTVAAKDEEVASGEKLARELGFKFKYVTKPFTQETLLSALMELGVAKKPNKN